MTEINTGIGGRILLANKILSLNEDIIMTYGDGLSDINIKRLIKFHYTKNADVTLTAVRPKQRYGVLKIEKNRVKQFDNRNKKIDVYVNGGFFIISKRAIKTIKAKETYWENQPLNYLIKRKKLFAYKHNGFWKSLDTMKDKNDFNEMYKKNNTMDQIKKFSKFWKNKRVLVTGHTGFKGSWLCMILEIFGAKIIGYSLKLKDFHFLKMLF